MELIPPIVRLNDGYALRPHQEVSIAWMKKREQAEIPGGILALTMGLGKTLISLYRIAEDMHMGPSLYICDKTVIGEVIRDLGTFFGQYTSIRCLVFHHEFTPRNYLRNFTVEELRKYDLIVTTYEACISSAKPSDAGERVVIRGEGFFEGKIVSYVQPKTVSADPAHYVGYSLLHQVVWRFIIADEAQKILNCKNKAFTACASLHGKQKFVLSGTPIRNSDKDMWSLLFFCGMSDIDMPRRWKYDSFKEKYSQALLHLSISDTDIVIPPLETHNYSLIPSGIERRIYRFYFEDLWHEFNRFYHQEKGNGEVQSFAVILALFTRLRQLCLAPYLLTHESKDRDLMSLCQYTPDTQWIPRTIDSIPLTGLFSAEDRKVTAYEPFVHDIIKSGFYATKINAAMTIIDSVLREENQNPTYPNKVMVFSAFTSVLYLMARYVMSKYQGMPSLMSLFDIVDGTTTGKIRLNKLARFRERPECRILFMNYKVGAMGINLVEANHVITMEPWWTGVFETQAKARAHRAGQKRIVHHHRMIMTGTIEEQIYRICDAKTSISNSYINTALESERIAKPGLDKETLRVILDEAWKKIKNEDSDDEL